VTLGDDNGSDVADYDHVSDASDCEGLGDRIFFCWYEIVRPQAAISFAANTVWSVPQHSVCWPALSLLVLLLYARMPAHIRLCADAAV
jgi:hypothetical protein